jgi:hypothetical protein
MKSELSIKFNLTFQGQIKNKLCLKNELLYTQ